ncbi:MAG: Clp protease N-terminal domain-containing protein [Terriglobales bacterium]|jgi:hypothetical protein
MLLGLLNEKETRANTILRLCELLPEETSQQARLVKQKLTKGTIPLSSDGKRTIAYAGREANQLRDYWIDTEHLVLGILREESNSAAVKLRAVGLELESCRQLVIINKKSRPPKRDPVLWWVRQRPVGFVAVAMVLFALGIAAALILLGFVAMGSTFAILAMLQFLRSVARGSAT